MNPLEKELSASLAYNRFMERRVVQLEGELRALQLKSTRTATPSSWTEPELARMSIDTQRRVGLSRHADPLSRSGDNSSQHSSLQNSTHHVPSALGKLALEPPTVASTGDSLLDSVGGVDALLQELIRLRQVEDTLSAQASQQEGTLQELREEVRLATLREGQANVRIQELEQELAEVRELLPEKLFGEKKEDDRRIKDILMVARQIHQQDLRYARGSSLAVAHHVMGEVEKHRTPQRIVKVMERANQPSSDANWRFLGAMSHMSEMGAAREQVIYDEGREALDGLIKVLKSIDETVPLYNVASRHAVSVVVEGQGASGSEECVSIRRRADNFLASLEALRVSRNDSILTAVSGLPSLAVVIRRMNNALLGASVRRVMKFAPALMAKVEEVAVAVEQYDVKANLRDTGIPVSPAEQALRLYSTRPPKEGDTDALSTQLWSASSHEPDGAYLAETEFKRVEVRDIRDLAAQSVTVEPCGVRLLPFLDQVRELLEKVHHVVQGTDGEDGVGNQANSKSVQCSLLSIRRHTTDAEDQYERLLHSFLQARAIERDALEELRKQTGSDPRRHSDEERKPWNFHSPHGARSHRVESNHGEALEAKIKELTDAKLRARRERLRGATATTASSRPVKSAVDDQFEMELEAQLAKLSS